MRPPGHRPPGERVEMSKTAWTSDDGRIVLYCADCLDVLPEFDEVDAVVTDPPYGMAFRSKYRTKKHRTITGDETDLLAKTACAIRAKHSVYVFCRWDNLYALPKPKSIIVWVKNNWSMGDLHHEHARQGELILFYPGYDHKWPSKRPADVVFSGRTGNNHHPSEKPIGLLSHIIRWTRGVVVDPFMGSGSTGIAAARLNRRFIGIEKDKQYFDIAKERIQTTLNENTLFAEKSA